MRVQWRCTTCGTTGWAEGWSEDDTNAAGISEDDPMEGHCEHIRDGGAYDLIDFDDDADDDLYIV